MGQTGSNMVKKYVSPWWKGSNPEDVKTAELALARFGGSPFILTRTGSMYFDEDGDLAHEFYEQRVIRRKKGRRRVVMCRCSDNLIPQGEVQLPHPRLHVDFPVVLCDTPSS